MYIHFVVFHNSILKLNIILVVLDRFWCLMCVLCVINSIMNVQCVLVARLQFSVINIHF